MLYVLIFVSTFILSGKECGILIIVVIIAASTMYDVIVSNAFYMT